MTNEVAFADQLLSTQEDARFGPKIIGPTTNPALQDYTPDRLIRAFRDLFDACCLPHTLPDPPRGVVGKGGRINEEAMELAFAGARYLVGFCRGEQRTLWNAHDQIRDALRKAYRDGYDARVAQEIKGAMAESGARNKRPSFVYFIRSAVGVKIGWALNPDKRLGELQTGHPHKLELAAKTPGDRRREREYHAQFREHRLHGEWFALHPEIDAEIARLNDLAANPSRLD